MEVKMDRQSNKITALYCRMAHYLTDEDILAGKDQMKTLSQYAADHHLENPHFYCDWGVSGIALDRPEYRRMLQDVIAGNVSDLVVLNLSRLGRNCAACWELIGQVLPQRGIAFHSVQDGNGIIKILNLSARIYDELINAYRLSQRGGRG